MHARGGGAHGYFEVTADVTPFTKARFVDRMGKRTPVFIRFSTVAGELGSPDTNRDSRGFAIVGRRSSEERRCARRGPGRYRVKDSVPEPVSEAPSVRHALLTGTTGMGGARPAAKCAGQWAQVPSHMHHSLSTPRGLTAPFAARRLHPCSRMEVL